MEKFLDTLIFLEKEHGKMGQIVGILLLAVITLSAVFAIAIVLKWWAVITNFILQKYFGYTLF